MFRDKYDNYCQCSLCNFLFLKGSKENRYLHYYNILILILRFNCFTKTASDTVQLKPAVKSSLKSTVLLYLTPFLPKSVVTEGN